VPSVVAACGSSISLALCRVVARDSFECSSTFSRPASTSRYFESSGILYLPRTYLAILTSDNTLRYADRSMPSMQLLATTHRSLSHSLHAA